MMMIDARRQINSLLLIDVAIVVQSNAADDDTQILQFDQLQYPRTD